MITIKLPITTSDDAFVLKKQKDYSYAFRKLYKNIDKINDEEFINKLRSNYYLSAYQINCLKIDVNTKYEQIKTFKSKIEDDIIELTNIIGKLKEEKKTKNITRKIVKLTKKLNYKNKSLAKDITFGTVNLLREITKLTNTKNNLLNENQNLSRENKLKLQETIISLNSKKQKYKNNRLLPISYYGSLNDKNSNRYFIFNFDENKITYKATNKKQIEITYKLSKKYKTILSSLQKIKDDKILPITVKLTTKHIFISFENEYLTNYKFNTKEYFNEINKIPKDNKLLRKEIFKKYVKEQENRKLKDKNINRYCAIDFNPEYIGFSIIDKVNDEIKIIHKCTYDLSVLLKKSNKSSNDKLTKYINNKRKYEIGKLYKSIFDKVNHFNVSHFVIEDLNFKNNKDKDVNKEFNRKTKNVWNLNFQKNLINKHCTNNGIILIEVNPIYTSFIGNLMYNDFDPTNASIEIARRGIFKYIKNNFYPAVTSTIIDTVVNRFSESIPDAQTIKDCENWRSLYKLLTKTKCRYRLQLCHKHNSFSHQNIKSNVKVIQLVE